MDMLSKITLDIITHDRTDILRVSECFALLFFLLTSQSYAQEQNGHFQAADCLRALTATVNGSVHVFRFFD